MLVLSLGLASEELDKLEQSPFTSVFFVRLKTPIPVEDVFFTQWPLLVARLICRMAIYTFLPNTNYMIGYCIIVLVIYSSRILGSGSVRTRRGMTLLGLILPNPLIWFWVRMQKWYHFCRFLNLGRNISRNSAWMEHGLEKSPRFGGSCT